MRKISLLIFGIITLTFFTAAQVAEGGGVYMMNNGKLINSVVRENYALNGFGVAGSSGEVINSTIVDNQYLNTSIVNPGDMFLADGNVFTPEYDELGNLVFPEGYDSSDVVGVCFWSNTNNNYIDGRFWIISVAETSVYWSPNGMTDGSGWNPIDIDSIFNYTTPEAVLLDFNGKKNTDFIVNEPGFIEDPGESYALTVENCAAKYCFEHMHNVNEEAEWFLPSIGQLRELEKEMPKVNEVLNKLGQSEISGRFWSSNEVSRYEAWSYFFPISQNAPSRENKKTNYKVRAMSIVKINRK